MEFCPECGGMLIPDKNHKLKCKCGYEKNLSKEEVNSQYQFEGDKNQKYEIPIIDKKDTMLPTTKIKCYRCGGTVGYWWILQTRSADEAPTYFVKCAKCGNTWRQSN